MRAYDDKFIRVRPRAWQARHHVPQMVRSMFRVHLAGNLNPRQIRRMRLDRLVNFRPHFFEVGENLPNHRLRNVHHGYRRSRRTLKSRCERQKPVRSVIRGRHQEQGDRPMTGGVLGLGEEQGADRPAGRIIGESAMPLRIDGLIAHRHGDFAMHIDPGVIVVMMRRIGDPVADENDLSGK